jgi:hypothetical protein
MTNNEETNQTIYQNQEVIITINAMNEEYEEEYIPVLVRDTVHVWDVV